ncbi:SWI/SNF-related matrix-associated actin-dependent regulator of chromatin, putative [Phytophthora infestans T30-4]|uniref:SWI/SNF-related matrix-associated actin-dependent regulator of chromatin, putative n=1 Tax=Phytophthora infestans (strain T30-4) TaxID=403677 RepID=D0MUR0_PHYIT|nr:SWI/SNF-related matrix-associated actin-dependent regulator of chromatin, putative [Phytophthora infestans T30-4]EEY61707.1 SWI/SNF-related matrix-associated actin-dependent regulator of chromatin, putative [Phytophthora infestans T30-4]|eukprot:XP_002908624.1 SWI/SNF-related matrix-associated actin-dependent regulator of chromatin, putative [Phytophthora infestans T30-4]
MAGREFAHVQPDNAEIERSVLSQEVEALRNRLGLRQVDVSKECGVNASMLSQWMLGRYKGNVGRVQINGLMESWLIRRRGGKPMDKGMMPSSPKLKRRLEEINDPLQAARRKDNMILAQRKLYSYPKFPTRDSLLIPIRLDIDIEGYRYIDSFSWNLYEKDFTYETFAAALVRDLDLPNCFYKRIAKSIQEQVEKAQKSLPWNEAVTGESLHPIFINLRLNDTIYIDRFEWDLNNSNNSPERFAQIVCEDLGLSGEFEAQVALSIREQLRDYARLIREGLKDRVSRLPPVTAAFRDRLDAETWGPSVKYILADDIPQLEREDFKRMRPLSRPTIHLTPPPAPVAKPNRPPKPVNTFLMFCRQNRKKIMADHPATSAKDASKILGDMWQKLSEKERASYIPMTEMENQRRMNEWRMKENALNGIHTTLTGGIATATASATTSQTNLAAIPGTPMLLAPRITPSMASPMDDVDDADAEDDEDDDDDDEDTASATGIAV